MEATKVTFKMEKGIFILRVCALKSWHTDEL